MSKKLKCAGCLAHRGYEHRKICRLGFRRELGLPFMGKQFYNVPIEECPKPLTWEKWTEYHTKYLVTKKVPRDIIE